MPGFDSKIRQLIDEAKTLLAGELQKANLIIVNKFFCKWKQLFWKMGQNKKGYAFQLKKAYPFSYGQIPCLRFYSFTNLLTAASQPPPLAGLQTTFRI